MKCKDKRYLKALLLASISTIGMPVVQAAGISGTIARKERDGHDDSTELVSEMLSNGILESHSSYGEMLGHTAHSSHASHGSHTSHISSGYPDGGGGSGNSSNNSTNFGLTALGLVGTIAVSYSIPYLIHHIIKTHKKHVASRKAEINRYHAYANRNLSSGIYGYDVDRMTDLLIDNDALESSDRTYSRKWSHYKFDRKVKRSVKRMQARMGRKRTGKASTAFLMSLQQWKNKRQSLLNAATKDSLDITEDRNALLAVAILLVEKGYLKNYDADDIMSEHEKSKIVKAYHEFLREKRLPEISLIDKQTLNLLNYSPNKQK